MKTTIWVPAVYLVLACGLAGCKTPPLRYCYASLVEQDGGFAYEMDGGYFYEPDGAYIYEPDGGYYYEPDGGYFYESDGIYIYEPDGRSRAIVCRGGVRCDDRVEDPMDSDKMNPVNRCPKPQP